MLGDQKCQLTSVDVFEPGMHANEQGMHAN